MNFRNFSTLSLSKSMRRNDYPCTAKKGYLNKKKWEKKELIKVIVMSLDKTIERRQAGAGGSSVKTKAPG